MCAYLFFYFAAIFTGISDCHMPKFAAILHGWKGSYFNPKHVSGSTKGLPWRSVISVLLILFYLEPSAFHCLTMYMENILHGLWLQNSGSLKVFAWLSFSGLCSLGFYSRWDFQEVERWPPNMCVGTPMHLSVASIVVWYIFPWAKGEGLVDLFLPSRLLSIW